MSVTKFDLVLDYGCSVVNASLPVVCQLSLDRVLLLDRNELDHSIFVIPPPSTKPPPTSFESLEICTGLLGQLKLIARGILVASHESFANIILVLLLDRNELDHSIFVIPSPSTKPPPTSFESLESLFSRIEVPLEKVVVANQPMAKPKLLSSLSAGNKPSQKPPTTTAR
ncbi:hypothetical protein EXIGLDRAFT_758815 [Exidia glandulosa HHB12029]|uniref:Uncharacterized protein n=1 Tax=Exidia glandulosa HHB12029 TaxID=1314781 RepID=A0A165QDT1_EXIGL|nr:hypothetical protein EXIGLDRAFT_758815 [Exidia glandulosa HHB12029]